MPDEGEEDHTESGDASMAPVYAAWLLASAGKDVTAEGVIRILEAAGLDDLPSLEDAARLLATVDFAGLLSQMKKKGQDEGTGEELPTPPPEGPGPGGGAGGGNVAAVAVRPRAGGTEEEEEVDASTAGAENQAAGKLKRRRVAGAEY